MERRYLIGTAALGLVLGAAVITLVLPGGEPQPVERNDTAMTTEYTDGSVYVNNSMAVDDGLGEALFEKDMQVERHDFHGHHIEREYTWLALYGTDVFPAYRSPPEEDGRPVLDISRRMQPGDGVPEMYAGVSLEEDADGEGYVEGRFYFDEEFRQLGGPGEPAIHWGEEFNHSKPIAWRNEVHPGVYMVTARDYNLTRHARGNTPNHPYFVAGYVAFADNLAVNNFVDGNAIMID